MKKITKFTNVEKELLKPSCIDPTARPPVIRQEFFERVKRGEKLEFMIVDYIVTDIKPDRVCDYSWERLSSNRVYENTNEFATSADARDLDAAKDAIAKKHAFLIKMREEALKKKQKEQEERQKKKEEEEGKKEEEEGDHQDEKNFEQEEYENDNEEESDDDDGARKGGDNDDDDGDDENDAWNDYQASKENEAEEQKEKEWKGVPSPYGDEKCVAYLMGVTKEGHSVCMYVPFKPYFFLEVHYTWRLLPHGKAVLDLLANDDDYHGSREDLEIEWVKRKKTFGYHPDDRDISKDKLFTFFKISFPSIAHMKKAEDIFRKNRFVLLPGENYKREITPHETRVGAGHKFLDHMNIVSSGWVSVDISPDLVSFPRNNQLDAFDPSAYRPENKKEEEKEQQKEPKFRPLGFRSHAQIEIQADQNNITPIPETDPRSDAIPPLVLASFDIESYSPSNKFPNFRKPVCTITAISTVYSRFGFPEKFKVEYCLKRMQLEPTPEPPQDKDTDYECTEIQYFDTEEEMLLAWRDLVVLKIDPDIVLGYNIKDFDLAYLSGRMCLYEPKVDGFSLADGIVLASQRYFFQSRLIKFRTPVVSRSVSTAAKGDRVTKSMVVPGRVIVDMYLHCKDGLRLKKLKLDDVAFEVLKKRKIPLNHEDHFALFRANIFDPKLRKLFWGLNSYIAIDVVDRIENYILFKKQQKDEKEEKEKRGGVQKARAIQADIFKTESDLVASEKAYDSLAKSVPDEQRMAARDLTTGLEKRLEECREGLGDFVREHIAEFRALCCYDLYLKTVKDLNHKQKGAGHQKAEEENQAVIAMMDEAARALLIYFEVMLRRRLSEYCAVDSLLPLMIMLNKSIVNNMVEMSRLCCTSLSDIEVRGQQIKVFSLIVTYAHRDNYVVSNVPFDYKKVSTEKYKGATVLEPTTGFYVKPVATLDFASLYPTIMRNNNLCFSSLLIGEQNNWNYVHKLQEKGMQIKTYEDAGKTMSFIQSVDGKPGKRGLLPAILDRLVASRARVKNIMKTTQKATEMYVILDARQLALKVSCNSVYGFCGVPPQMAMLPCRPVAQCTTAEGRNMILRTKNIVMNVFPQKFAEECEGIVPTVIYGDSVTGDTPVILRISDPSSSSFSDSSSPSSPSSKKMILVTRIDVIFSKSLGHVIKSHYKTTKDEIYEPGIEIWQNGKFTPVKRVIRHNTDKPLVRVKTALGMVDCTTDHSLVKANGQKVRPSDVTIGDELMHSDDRSLASILNESSSFSSSSSLTPTFYFDDDNNLKQDAVSTKIKYNLLGQKCGEFKNRFSCVHIKDEADTMNLSQLVQAPLSCVTSFWEGLLSASNSDSDSLSSSFSSSDSGVVLSGSFAVPLKDKEFTLKFDSKYHATLFWVIASRIGYRIRFLHDGGGDNELIDPFFDNDDKNMVLLFSPPSKDVEENNNNNNKNIVEIVPIPRCDNKYVYDFETEDHLFHVGPGLLVVHNTDSVMIHFDKMERRMLKVEPDPKIKEMMEKNVSCVKTADGGIQVTLTVQDSLIKEDPQDPRKEKEKEEKEDMTMMEIDTAAAPRYRQETELEYMQRVFDIATHMGEYISNYFKENGGLYTDLAFEKVYYPYLLMKKKNYIGLKYEDDASYKPKIDMKGIDIVKRSVCGYVQQAASSLIPPLMYLKSQDIAGKNLMMHIQRLMDEKVTLEDLVHYTKMSASYKDGGDNLPQVVVQKKQKARNPGSEAKPGDYVAFIVTEVKGADPSKLKVFEHVEDYEYAKANNIKPDRYYILKNKLRNLVYKILQFTDIDVDKMLEEPLRKLENSMMGRSDVKKFFTPIKKKEEPLAPPLPPSSSSSSVVSKPLEPLHHVEGKAPMETSETSESSEIQELKQFKRKAGELNPEEAKRQKKVQDELKKKSSHASMKNFFSKK